MLLVTAKGQVNVSPIWRGNVGTNVATMTGETSTLPTRKSAGQTFPRSGGETLGTVGRERVPTFPRGVCLVETPPRTGTRGPVRRPGGVK